MYHYSDFFEEVVENKHPFSVVLSNFLPATHTQEMIGFLNIEIISSQWG